jgi:cobalamin 5'-phosphate synthase/cobalamin synthase
MKLLKGFALAFSTLTILPFFKIHTFFRGINGYSAMFYPVVGLVLGSLLWGFALLLEGVVPPLHLSVLVFGLWVLLTGALHLDGLSDTIDGLFVPKQKALEVMKDSHVGGMGMLFSGVFLLIKLSALYATQNYHLLPIVLMLSRLNATLAIYFYNYIGGGMGALLKEELRLWHLGVAFGLSLVITLFSTNVFVMFVSLATLITIATFFTKRLGGLSGDIYGFIIELSEVAILHTLLFLLCK